MIDLKALENANKVSVTYKVDNIDSEYVKAFRKKYSLTKPTLANLMGVSLRTVCRWEDGKGKIGWNYAVLFTLFSHNYNLIEQIRKVEYLQGD